MIPSGKHWIFSIQSLEMLCFFFLITCEKEQIFYLETVSFICNILTVVPSWFEVWESELSSNALLQYVLFKSFCKYSDEGLKGKFLLIILLIYFS